MRRLSAAMMTVLVATASTQASARDDQLCRSVVHERARYTVCTADPARHTIDLAWRSPKGQPYGSLSALPREHAQTGKSLLFALNAGMYDPALKPVGLYIEDGKRYVKANTRRGKGNFHLLPNGIFFVANGRPGVLETRAYLRTRPKAVIATQSGPMLVIDGRLHPKFKWAEKSRKMRNGVGIDARGKALFAISEVPVSFASFGRMYRDLLKCRNALFLDGGSVPTLYAPRLGRGSNFLPLGPMLAIYGR